MKSEISISKRQDSKWLPGSSFWILSGWPPSAAAKVTDPS